MLFSLPEPNSPGQAGLQGRSCGKIIDVFKRRGGKATALKENLRFLATLPLELEVVKEGDAGDISLLTNDELEITREFNKMVDEIVKLTETSTLNFARAGSFHIYRSNIKRR